MRLAGQPIVVVRNRDSAGRKDGSQRGHARMNLAPASASTCASHVGGSLRASLQVELAKDRADVVLDRLVGQEYLGRDLLVRLALRDQEQDLLLLGRQLGELVWLIAAR